MAAITHAAASVRLVQSGGVEVLLWHPLTGEKVPVSTSGFKSLAFTESGWAYLVPGQDGVEPLWAKDVLKIKIFEAPEGKYVVTDGGSPKWLHECWLGGQR
eukprot:2258049-Lingulodinium_polyedra.AAC.1